MPTAIFVPPMSTAPITISPSEHYSVLFPRIRVRGGNSDPWGTLASSRNKPNSSVDGETINKGNRNELRRAALGVRLAKNVAKELSHWPLRRLPIGATSPLA